MSDPRKLPLCQNLRVKGMFVHTEEAPPPVETETAVWWCVRTMQSVGPDDDACHRNFCCEPSRSCYEGPRA